MGNDLKGICPIQANRQVPQITSPPFGKGMPGGISGMAVLNPYTVTHRVIIQKGEIE